MERLGRELDYKKEEVDMELRKVVDTLLEQQKEAVRNYSIL